MTRQVNDGRHRWVEGMECEGGWRPWGTVVEMDCGRSGRVELPVAGVGRRKRIKNRKTSGRVGRRCSSCGQAAGRAALHAKERENNRLLLYFAVRSSVRVRLSRTTLPKARLEIDCVEARSRFKRRYWDNQGDKGDTASSRPSARHPGCVVKMRKEASRHGIAPRHYIGKRTLRRPLARSFGPRQFPATKRGAEQAMVGPR